MSVFRVNTGTTVDSPSLCNSLLNFFFLGILGTYMIPVYLGFPIAVHFQNHKVKIHDSVFKIMLIYLQLQAHSSSCVWNKLFYLPPPLLKPAFLRLAASCKQRVWTGSGWGSEITILRFPLSLHYAESRVEKNAVWRLSFSLTGFTR